jgi:hypothetical protein
MENAEDAEHSRKGVKLMKVAPLCPPYFKREGEPNRLGLVPARLIHWAWLPNLPGASVFEQAFHLTE